MTHQQARNLLRRKKLKGEEIGRALLLSFVSDYEQRASETPTQLFTQQELNHMVTLLPSEYERSIYAEYVKLHDSIVALFHQAQGMEQQLHNGLYSLSSRLRLACKLQLLFGSMYDMRTLESVTLIENTLNTMAEVFAMDTFAGLAGDPDTMEDLKTARNQMSIPSYVWLTGYNATLDAYAEGLSFPQLRKLCMPLDIFLTQAKASDTLRAEYSAFIPEDLFAPLYLEHIQPDKTVLREHIASLQKSGPVGHYPLSTLYQAMDAWREVL